jgi:DNA-binding SARP family transcriptional activator
VYFRILGSVEATGEDGPLSLGGRRQRAVLAALLLHAPHVVSRDALIADVWGPDAPETAATALHGHVSTLRKAIGNDRIVTRAPGYALRIDQDELDVRQVDRLVGEGEAALARGEPARAGAALAAALELWRGEPLAGLEAVPFVEGERRRLEERHLAALELRIDADLALGRHREVVAELSDLVREHPLRERFRAQLMLALYRSGRQAEALEAYADGRRLLASELGLEPGDELRALQRSILEQDPAIATPRPERSARRRRLRLVAAGAAIAAVTAVVGAVAFTRGGASTIQVAADSVAVVDPRTNRVVADVHLGARPEAIAAGYGAAWAAQPSSGTIARIDAKTRHVTVFGTGTPVRSLAVGFGRVWAADGERGTVSRINPDTRRVDRTFTLGRKPVLWVATSERSVWVGRPDDIVRFEPDGSNRRRFAVGRPTGMVAAGGIKRIFNGRPSSTIDLAAPDAAWVSTGSDELLKVGRDGSTGSALVGALTFGPVVENGTVWVIAYLGRGAVVPVDGTSLALGRAVGVAYPLALAAGEGAVWAVDTRGTLTRIDPTTTTPRVVARIPTAPTVRAAVAAGAGRVWVAVQRPY